jgi:hypothetical protein
MKLFRTLTILVFGFVIGVAFVVSCGDDNSLTEAEADAAVSCDCPAAEPPLANRVVRVVRDQVVPATSFDAVSAICDFGTIVLSGGCFARSSDAKYILNSSYPAPPGSPNPAGWVCEFYNGTPSPVTSSAYVTCLKPAP